MLFYIFRHGETEGNVKNLVQGAGLDLPLNENGKDQAAVLGQTLAVLKFPVSIRESINRSVKALEKIKSKAEGNRVAVATHGALMHNIYQHYFGLRRRFANCEYFVIDI